MKAGKRQERSGKRRFACASGAKMEKKTESVKQNDNYSKKIQRYLWWKYGIQNIK